MTDADRPLNREERRRQRFHPRQAAGRQDDLRPAGRVPGASGQDDGPPADREREPGGADQGSFAGSSEQGAVKTTGAGTGGATESSGRLAQHDGMDLPSSPND